MARLSAEEVALETADGTVGNAAGWETAEEGWAEEAGWEAEDWAEGDSAEEEVSKELQAALAKVAPDPSATTGHRPLSP